MKAVELKIRDLGSSLDLLYGAEEILPDVKPLLFVRGSKLEPPDGLKLESSKEATGSDAFGKYRAVVKDYLYGSYPTLRASVKVYESGLALFELEALRRLSGLYRGDDFSKINFNYPTFSLLRNCEVLTFTWGLSGVSEPFPDGEWPRAITGPPSSLPSDKPFSPLIVDLGDVSLAISASNYFLTSPLALVGRERVARGLHGSVDIIDRGFVTESVMILGEDKIQSLIKWGDFLLRKGGKTRVDRLRSRLLSKLGYWNCYGSYYTELLNKFDEKAMVRVMEAFKKAGVELGYLGLDLWYPYEEIGLAKAYRPDPLKYPNNLKGAPPLFLHLSAFSKFNEYKGKYKFLDGKYASLPLQFELYYDIAKELKALGAFGIWHDWLWAQQYGVEKLRSDPTLADSWFKAMCSKLAEEGLVIMLCMPTVGFLMASTQAPNVIAARSYTDYLFRLREQVGLLRERGLKLKAEPRADAIYNNFMVGTLIYALGMYPYFDVFITSKEGPKGFRDELSELEALTRALSCGPVGIGDREDLVNWDLVRKLVLPDGTLAKPDRPSLPLNEYFKGELLGVHTLSEVNGRRWFYLAFFNLSSDVLRLSYDFRALLKGGRYLLYDFLEGALIEGLKVDVNLEPLGYKYYVAVPLLGEGKAMIGLVDKYITFPSSHFKLSSLGDEVEVKLKALKGALYKLGLRIPEGVEVKGAKVIREEGAKGFSEVTLKALSQVVRIIF